MRLGFAVAISVNPDILLTDEVLAVGDEAFQRKCLDYIAGLRRRGVTIIFVSHALDAVRSLCRRAIWLDKGKIVADGPSAEVIDRYLAFENEKHAERTRAAQIEGPGVSAPLQVGTLTVTDQAQAADLDAEVPGEESQEASVPVDAPGSRWTTGEVSITDVQFLGENGEPTTLFLTGRPLTIRISYDAHRRTDDPAFGLALYTEGGTQLNGPNTRFAGLEIPYIEGAGAVEYHIAELPLLSGRYDVTVAVTGADMSDILDHQHRAYSFYVQPTPGLAERWGVVNIPASWRVAESGRQSPR